MIGGDEAFDLTDVGDGEGEVLAGFGDAAGGFEEGEGALAGEGASGGGGGEDFDEAAAAGGQARSGFVVVPKVERAEVDVGAEVPGDFGGEGVAGAGDGPGGEPHGAAGGNAVLAAAEAGAVDGGGGGAVGSGELGGEGGGLDADDFAFLGGAGGSLVAKGVVVPGAAGDDGEEGEGDGAGTGGGVAVAEDVAVARARGVFIAEKGGAGVRGGERDEAVSGGAEADRVKACLVSLARGQAGEGEAGLAVVGGTVEEFGAEVAAAAGGGEVIGAAAAAVVDEGGIGPAEGPGGAAADFAAGGVEGEPVDGEDGGWTIEGDFMGVGAALGEAGIAVTGPGFLVPDAGAQEGGAGLVDLAGAEAEAGLADLPRGDLVGKAYRFPGGAGVAASVEIVPETA